MKYPRTRSLRPGAVIAALVAAWPGMALAAGPAWDQWQSVPGVFDIAGPRSDGAFVVAAPAALYLLDPSGTLTPFARGAGGYHDDAGKEAYLAVSAGGHVESATCDFAPDETFILRQHFPFGVTRVSADGEDSGSFANIPGVTALSGITFDTGGAFDQRLLVTGTTTGGGTSVFAVDCHGKVATITRAAPPVEGGIAVAPTGFGAVGQQLIAPEAVSGRVFAIAPNGKMTSIGRPSLPRGPEVGIESVGFVPTGFLAQGGFAYVADPGTGHILRLSSADLASTGGHEGDVLVATEGGAALVFIHCDQRCAGTYVIQAPGRAHAEGHIVFSKSPAEVAPSPIPAAAAKPLVPPGAVDFAGQWGLAMAILIGALAFGAGLVAKALRRRAK